MEDETTFTDEQVNNLAIFGRFFIRMFIVCMIVAIYTETHDITAWYVGAVFLAIISVLWVSMDDASKNVIKATKQSVSSTKKIKEKVKVKSLVHGEVELTITEEQFNKSRDTICPIQNEANRNFMTRIESMMSILDDIHVKGYMDLQTYLNHINSWQKLKDAVANSKEIYDHRDKDNENKLK